MIRNIDKSITIDSNILQVCVCEIRMSEIESVDLLNDKTYRYGSLNYIRANGKRIKLARGFL